MAFAMNRNLLEREWIRPKLREFMTLASDLDSEKDPVGYVKVLFGSLALETRGPFAGQFFYVELLPQAYVWFAIFDLYEDKQKELENWTNKQLKQDKLVTERAIMDLISRGDTRFPPGENVVRFKRRRASVRIIVNGNDNSWILKTRIPRYFGRHTKAFRDLLNLIEQNVKSERDILGALLPPS